jgi:DNA ligase (NAD+)
MVEKTQVLFSAKTDYVLAGDKMGPSKLEKAQKLRLKIISEGEFLTMIGL